MTPSEFRRVRRGALDMTQEQLAAAMGISPRTVHEIERRKDKVETFYALAITCLADRAVQPAE